MQFSFRAAIVIAAFCAASLVGSGTPGFAIEPDKSVLPSSQMLSLIPNAALPANVPAPAAAPLDAPSSIELADDVRDVAAEQRFETLSAAVAAQAMPDMIDPDLACLAGTIYFEAKGEPLSGQLAVAQVVLNRAQSGRFPRSICSVVTQRGQFSFVRGGRMPPVSRGNPAYRTAMAVAQVAMDKGWESPAGSALFFHARRVSPGWRLTRVASIGNHVFYR